MTMTLGTLMKQLLAMNRKAFPVSMYYVFDAYAERLNKKQKLIFSSRNGLFRDTDDPQVVLDTAKKVVLKLSVISAKIDGDHCYIRVDC